MDWNLFATQQQWGITFIFGLYCAAVFLFHFHYVKWSLVLLMAATLLIGMFIASLFPYLHLWDEQFHALVAKNMLQHPFKPTLYRGLIFPFDFKDWTANHVWLHKQPLFLWQMALSLKLFGCNAMAVRLPSIFLHTLSVWMVYRMGKIFYHDKIGFYGALLFSVSSFVLGLSTGLYSTDHNDAAFLFYITASLWAWVEYKNSDKWYWIFFIGFFSGCSILVKWLVGWLVFAVWGISSIANRKLSRYPLKKEWLNLFLSFLVSLLVFLPWQLYIVYKFPHEARYELQYNSLHFFQIIEGHSGGAMFHFDALRIIYGSSDLFIFFVFISLFLFLLKMKNKCYRLAVLSSIVLVYGFYTLAQTKMLAFGVIVSPFVYLALATLFCIVSDWIFRWRNIKRPFQFFQMLLLLFFAFHVLNFHKFTDKWNPKNHAEQMAHELNLKQLHLSEQINKRFIRGKWVVFNASIRMYGNIEVMFFTPAIAYNFIPTKEQIRIAKKKGYSIAIVDNDLLPDYLAIDNTISKIKLN
jgi:4-amino-4-deoxy-L-arabinose transferase